MQVVLVAAIILLLVALVREHRLRRKAESKLHDVYKMLAYENEEKNDFDGDQYRAEWNSDPPLSAQPLRDYVARRNPEGPVFAIRYQSLTNATTERIVMPAIIDAEDGEGTFQAYCYLRDDLRTFNLKRVIDYFDPETGEVFASFNDALSKGEMISKRWKLERQQRRKAGEKPGVYRG